MLILNFGPEACHDCHRPPGAGGHHNAGCKLNPRRLCVLCEHPHNKGDDVHLDRFGNYCSYEFTIETKVKEWPGYTRERCVAYVDLRMAEMKRDIKIYEWIKANPLAQDIILAAVRGVRD